MRLDVFTQVPHAFAWMTEQRPLAAVLGTELELRLFNYRDTTPLRAGQVDDEPYGGGAGMVLRVDVVAAALDAVYGSSPEQRVIALTPQGRPLTQAVVEELAAEPALTLLSSRFEGFDERIVTHLASDAISIGPYVLSGGELPAMVLLDAIARRLPGALAEGSGEHESFSTELEGGLEYPHYTRPAEFRGWTVPGGPALRRPRPRRRVAHGAEPRAERRPDGDVMSDFERYGWEPDGSRQDAPPPPAPVKTEESGSTGLALVAGLVAAIAGGVAWGLISKYTSYEVGVVAWGIGFLCGFAVERAAGGRRSADLQAIAIVTALLGVLLGKYLGFAFAVQEAEQGLPNQTGLLSGEMFTLFRENLGEVFGLFDLLWTGLAVASAWYALRPETPEAETEPAPAPTVDVAARVVPRAVRDPGRGGAGGGAAAGAALPQPRRPAHPRPAARLARHDRLGGDDRRRDRDRARDQGVGREPVPDPVLVDGADAPLRPARERLRGALLRPRAREPLHLPLPRPEAGRDRRLRDAARRAAALRRRRHLRQAADRPARRPDRAPEHRAARATSSSTASSSTSPTSSRTGATRAGRRRTTSPRGSTS